MLLSIIINGSIIELEDCLRAYSPQGRWELLNRTYTDEQFLVQSISVEPIPLHVAAYFASPNVIKLLLNHGALPNMMDHKGRTALSILCHRLHVTYDFLTIHRCFQQLIFHNANIPTEIIDHFVDSSIRFISEGLLTHFYHNNYLLKSLFYHHLQQMLKKAVLSEDLNAIDSYLSNAHLVTHPENDRFIFCSDIHLDLNAIPDLPFIVATTCSPRLLNKLDIYGLDWKLRDHSERNVFHHAAYANRSDNIYVLTRLLNAQAYSLLTQPDKHGLTPLKIASEQRSHQTLCAIENCLTIALRQYQPTMILYSHPLYILECKSRNNPKPKYSTP